MTKQDVNVEPTSIPEASLVYLSPLDLVSVTGVTKKGRFGDYLYGYSIVLTTENGKKVEMTLRKDSAIYAQLIAIKVLHDSVKRFTFADDNGKIIVSGSLA